MTEQELREHIKELESELAELSKSKFDKLTFRAQRNNAIGSTLVGLHQPELKWIGGYTDEAVPQHWLYYVLVLLGNLYPDRIEHIYTTLEINSHTELKNNKPSEYKYLPFPQTELYNFLIGIMGLLVKSQGGRTKIGDAVQEVMRGAMTYRRKEIIELSEQLRIYKEQLKTYLPK